MRTATPGGMEAKEFSTLRMIDATAADADAIAAFHTASWRSAYRGLLSDAYLDGPLADEKRAHWRARLAALEPGDFVVTARDEDDRLVGFAAVWPDPALFKGAFLDNLHAAPDARRRGIGRALMAEIARRLLARGDRQIWLTVYPENARAVGFYRAMGGVEGLAMSSDHDGAPRPAVVYFWRDLDVLAARSSRAEHGSQRENAGPRLREDH